MKQTTKISLRILALILLTTAYFFISTKDLDKDVINPDGINWHTRTQAFTEALSKGNYSDTFQAYHPGTTLMWISGPLLNVLRPVKYDDAVDPKTTFLERDYYAKLSVVTFGTVLFALTLILLWNLVGFKYASFYAIVFTLEPFIIGMRRLYHLDFLMTSLTLLSFLLLIYFNYKKQQWFLLILSGLFYALALLTKSTAIIFLPIIPFIFILGNSSLLKKLVGLLAFIAVSIGFIYAFFPPIWKHPIESAPKYYTKIANGITDIGIVGKKEMGTSGEGENTTLDETVADKDRTFYAKALFMRLSVSGCLLLIVALIVSSYSGLKSFVLLIRDSIKSKSIRTVINPSIASWISIWSIGISLAALIVLTLAAKKSDRYEILIFPFVLLVVASFFNKLKLHISIPIIVLYSYFVIRGLVAIHPYYLAYSNPLLGGIEARLEILDNSPFGIGTYAAFDIIKKDREVTGYDGYYTVSGSKSIKAISAGGRFSRFPSCVTDYIVTFALANSPTRTCTQKYILLDTVKVAGYDYWYVYKRLSQVHESNYD
jgi:hypothetical protein